MTVARNDGMAASAAGEEVFHAAGTLGPPGSRYAVEFFVRLDATAMRAQLWVPEQKLLELDAIEVNMTGEGQFTMRWQTPRSVLTLEVFDGQCEYSQSGRASPCEASIIDASELDDWVGYSRPQTPEAPFPYAMRDVHFSSEDGSAILAGTLTLPSLEQPHGSVVLVSGSGPQDRYGNFLGHKTLLVLSDALTRSGFAVLSYDDRGIGRSTGRVGGSLQQNRDDARAAVRFLRSQPEVDTTRVIVVGHSEGGIIARMLAADDDVGLAAIVALAAPFDSGVDTLAFQMARQILGYEASQERLEGAANALANFLQVELEDDVSQDARRSAEKQCLAAGLGEAALLELRGAITSEWLRSFLIYDPGPDLSNISIPHLSVFGEKDMQVPAASNVAKLQVLPHSQRTEGVVIAGVNHLMQRAETGRPEEYEDIEETVSPAVIQSIVSWLLSNIGSP